MLVVPLVTFSLICGVCGLGDVSKLGRVGLKSFALFLLTLGMCIFAAISAIFKVTRIDPAGVFSR
jgi:Na+/H+-dicarboxylate symporter